MARQHGMRSLRVRLLVATLVALVVALTLAGLLLGRLFHDHVMRQFSGALTVQLNQLTARLEFDAQGQPQLDAGTLSDPRWSLPYSGLYWQIDGEAPAAVLRSRSLWDAALQVPADRLAAGEVHVHPVAGPANTRLLLVERRVRPADGAAPAGGGAWRLLVAADLSETEAAVQRFQGVLAASLAALGVLLGLAAWAQVGVGLAPLRTLQRALGDVHSGRSNRLQGQFPAELQPLVDDFNGVLDQQAEGLARARTQAGNLAHALKTPLAALSQAATLAAGARPQAGTSANPETGTDQRGELASLVQEQVGVARRHIDWHLARARAAAAQGLPGTRSAVAPLVDGLLRVMQRVHAERGLQLQAAPMAADLAFAGEAQDLQEIVGNLLDNACKWARQQVRISAQASPGPGPDATANAPRLQLVIEDDGPGIGAAQRQAVLARGTRLDESVPGSGLGLAIVHELVGLYGGQITLSDAAGGGLRVVLDLPRA